MNGNYEVWAMVIAPGGKATYAKRSRIRFERDICFVVDPGKNMFEVTPKKVERADAVTLVVDTGFLHYGDVKMIIDSSSEAGMVEQKLRAHLSNRKGDKSG